MTVLLWIVVVSIFGGALSVSCAALFALNARAHWVNSLVSYAIGALLGAAFLEILPEALKLSASVSVVSGAVLAGILLFFTLEKLLLWRHCHSDHCEAHDPVEHAESGKPGDHGRSGTMIMVGNTFHNFVDGIIIAAAFLADVHLGIVTAMAIIAHEIPQEVGDFMILLHSGYTKAQALLFNLASSLATFLGGVLAYYALRSMQNVVPTLLALAAASMIYVAVADLIPGLHKRTTLRDTLEQVVLIALGISSIVLVQFMVSE
jgi:zinc and cadmium transporter